jgi:hypothetical protein
MYWALACPPTGRIKNLKRESNVTEPIVEDTNAPSPTAVTYVEEVPVEKVETYIYSEPAPAIGDLNRRYVDSINEAARASALGQDPTSFFLSVQDNPLYDADAVSERILTSVGSITDQVAPKVEKAIASGEDPASHLESYRGKIQSIGVAEVSSQAMMDARAYVESIPTIGELSPREKEDAIYLKYLERMSATVADEIGWNWGTVADVAGFLVPQENIRYEEVADILGVEYNAMDALDYRDFLERTSDYLLSEAPEKRQAMVEQLVSAWPEIHGDNRIALLDTLNVLSGVEDPRGGLRTIENYFERLDQATIGGMTVGKVVSGGIKAMNAIRTATALRNVEAVTDIVTAGSRGVLNEAGVSPMDAATSLNPMNTANVLVRGADNTYATEVGNIQKDVDIYLEAAEKVDNYGLALNPDEQVALHNRVVRDLVAQGNVRDVSVKTLDDLNYEVSFTADNGVKYKVKQPYTRDAIGGFRSKDGEGHINVDLKVTSPVYRFVSDREVLVNIPEQLQFQGNKIQGMYDSAMRAALAPNGKKLSAKEMKDVEYVLMKGDEALDDLGFNSGKVYDDDELMTEGVGGVVLNKRQVESYKSIRKVVDHLHKQKNAEIIARHKADGLKYVDFGVRNAESPIVATSSADAAMVERANANILAGQVNTIPVKPYKTAVDAAKGYRMANTRSSWVAMPDGKLLTYKSALEMPDELMEQMYAQGYSLARASEKKLIKARATNVEWAFVKNTEMREPGGVVLSYRTGYIPRIKKDAFYFVKESKDVSVGGSVIKGGATKTVRYFDNYMDASKYADDLNLGNPGKYKVLADRELSSSDLEEEFINISGGLFTGARSEGVPFGLRGGEGDREGVLESLQRYIRNISRNTPMNLYRGALQQRWMNHAMDLGALPKNYAGSFEDAVHGNHIDLNNKSSGFLVDAHNQISFLTGIRTDAERAMLARQRKVAQALEAVPGVGKWMSRRIMNTSEEGLISAIRGANFHLLLGLYNPAQFPIQASGAFVAMSIHPIHGLKAVSQMLAYATLDNILGNPAQKAAALNKMRNMGLDVDGYDAWDRSGVRESILKSNLDYHSIFTDMPYDAGVLNKVLSNSTFFHKSGELVSARVAFATSYNYWRAKPGNANKLIGLEDRKEILAHMETLRLNMTRANSAKFQQGALSIPTQFQQVNTKFFEKLLGTRELSPAQKFSLIAGQAVIFGFAGVPLVKALTPYFLEAVNSAVPEENRIDALNASPETLNWIQNGTLAWILNDYMDINAIITGRMALGTDFVQTVFDSFTEPLVLLDIAKGPTKTLWDGSLTGYERTRTALSFVQNAEYTEPEDYLAVAGILAESVANLPSSTRNLLKSYDMTHSQFFRNSKGRAIAEWQDNNTQTIVAQALGFAPSEVAHYHELNMRNAGAIPKSVFSSDTDRIVQFLVKMNSDNDVDNARRYGMALNAILTKYERPQDRVQIIKEVSDKLKNPKDPWGKLMLGIIKDWESDLHTGVGELHSKLSVKINPTVARKFEERNMNTATNEEK